MIFRDITDRQKTETNLIASEKKYRELYQSMRDAFVRTDMEGFIVEFNEAFQEMIGYSAEEIKQFTYKDITPADWHALEEEIINNQILTRGYSDIYEKEYRRRDGTVFPVELRTFLVRDHKGNPENMWATIRDITDRKQAEKAVQEAESFLRSTLDALSAHIAILDEKGFILAVNRSWRQFALDNPPIAANVNEGANYLSVCDGAHGDDAGEAQMFAAGICSVLSGEKNEFSHEYPCHSSDEKRWFVGRVTCFKAERGTYIVVSHENITERKQAEIALQQAEENFRRSLDESPLGVRIVTRESDLLYANKAILDIYGYDSVEELKNTQVEQRYTPEGYNKYLVRREKRQRGIYVPSEYEISIVDKKGEVHHLQVFRKEVFWSGQKQYQVLYHDITKRKMAEKQKLNLLERLKIEQKQIRTLSRRIVELQEIERRALARELHDNLGQNLAAIGINLTVLSDLYRPEAKVRIEDCQKLLNRSIQNLRDVITELRPPGIDDDGLEAALRWYCGHVQQRTGILVELTAQNSNHRFSPEEEINLFRIAQEALTNTAKHSKATRAILSLTGQGREFTLKISDNGIGFKQLGSHTSSKHSGWGLINMRERALSIGANFQIQSIPGKGTTIKIEGKRQNNQ